MYLQNRKEKKFKNNKKKRVAKVSPVTTIIGSFLTIVMSLVTTMAKRDPTTTMFGMCPTVMDVSSLGHNSSNQPWWLECA
jgi:hypothetical protein